LRIGLDLDNTLADYDGAFPRVARLLGIATAATTKRALKDELRAAPGGDETWQRVQGLVYGRHIGEAVPHEGVLEFVARARLAGHDLWVVSHKTEFGHHDESRTPLREAAMRWLAQRGIVGDGAAQIPASQVRFADTRDAKVAAIAALDLDAFVDDLEEVLVHPGFPPATRRVWFVEPSVERDAADAVAVPRAGADGVVRCTSWREVGEALLGEPGLGEVAAMVAHEWPDAPVGAVEHVQGRGNSRIYRVERGGVACALKMYPDLRHDPRPRRATEWAAVRALGAAGLPVPVAIGTSESLNWSLFGWVDGAAPAARDADALDAAIAFVDGLRALGRAGALEAGPATEACLRPCDVLAQVDARVARLARVDDAALAALLRDEVAPARDERAARARAALGAAWDAELPAARRIPSPSDFGFHNAVRGRDGRITFIDFEYFGWDDPVKLVADLALHPGSALDAGVRAAWLASMRARFADDPTFGARLDATLPLYAVRWALIALNEFLGDKAKNRRHARSRLDYDLRAHQAAQLAKARTMLTTPLPTTAGGSPGDLA
jgi:hypothetical protein